MMRYSASLGGFIDSSLWLKAFPSDAVAVAQDDYELLIAEQSSGKQIVADDRGYPVAIARPEPSADELGAQAAARRKALLLEASLLMSPLQDAVEMGIATADEIKSLEAWRRYRVELGRVDQQPGFPRQVDWPAAPA